MANVFKKAFKTFESDITGELKEYKVNNALWLYLETKHKLTQAEWAKGYDENQALYGSYFVAGVLKANGLDVTFKTVLENTTLSEIVKFISSYQVETLGIDLNKKSEEDKDDIEDEGE